LYNATSYGGKGAIGDLCAAFARKRINPYVMLSSSSYRHKSFGKTFNPLLSVVGWENDGAKSLPAKPAAELDDDSTIPF
jgi:hypothetical protein